MRTFSRRPGTVRRAAIRMTALAGTILLVLPAALRARSDTAPPPGVPETVSADALPTWQVDGVVWSEATVGNTVYAVGRFTKVRPPGTRPGSAEEVSRSNILAFDITTGKLITSFDHSLNAQGLRVVAAPDGKRIYVGGYFTTVDGRPRHHIAAFDTATGALDPGFHPAVSSIVRAIAATRSAVYFGGNFFSVDGSRRVRLAAAHAATGSLMRWAPVADDDEVYAMVMAPGERRVIVGGRFQHLNHETHVGIGAVDAGSGVSVQWTSTPIPARLGSAFSYVTDLTTDGTTIYGSADGEGTHWFDGRFAAVPDTGALIWLDNCYGATYGVFVQGTVLYSVSHAHDCTSLGAFPDDNPGRWHRALAETTYPTGIDRSPPGANSRYAHQPIPSLLHWFPTLAPGTVTGLHQAAWAITGNAGYLAVGGEFPTVNGKEQQGLVRFAVKAIAPNKVGPPHAVTPTATRLGDGSVRVSWQATWDEDNARLHYEVLREGRATPVGSVDASSNFWTLPTIGFVDKGVAPGFTPVYRIRVSDPFGNNVTSGPSLSSRSAPAPTSITRPPR